MLRLGIGLLDTGASNIAERNLFQLDMMAGLSGRRCHLYKGLMAHSR